MFYAQDGIPFLRVQNILPEGLSLKDVIYINEETHNGFLKRSKVSEDNLLVTITGRIASSCVAPRGFDGNINQHSVVIKTENREISETLAAFLNSTFGQNLALRRTTGGTRPALDYVALKSIPIVFKPEMVSVVKNAYGAKAKKESEARNLLASIDDYVLAQLGIEWPDAQDSSLQSRIFYTTANKVTGGRFDPQFSFPFYLRLNETIQKVEFKTLKRLAYFSYEIWNQQDYFAETFPYIEISGIDIFTGEVSEVSEIPKANAPSRARMIVRSGDILVSTTRPNRGAITLIQDSHNLHIGSTGFAVIRETVPDISKPYLLHLLRHRLSLMQMERRSSGGNYPAITLDELQNIMIPIVNLNRQDEIVAHIEMIYQQAKQLRAEGKAIVERAKQEVEAMILGEESSH